jgi:integrase
MVDVVAILQRMQTRLDGVLLVRERQSGPVYYAKWRDSSRTQVMRRLGPAWAEPHGDGWRKRRGVCPDGYLVPNDAASRMRELIDEHERELAETRSDQMAGEPNRSVATFAHVAWAWHAHGETVLAWKPSTVRDRRSTLRVHLIPAFGSRPVRGLERDEIRRWWRSLHDPRRTGGRLSDRNANKVLAELRAILTWAADDYRLTGNVADGIRKHRELTSERPDYFSVGEVEQLIAAAGERDGLMFRVASFAGLRRGELISLRWRHIDFDRSLMHVVENVSAGQDARVKDHEGRTVPLAPQLADALLAWRSRGARDDDLVFPGTLPGRKIDGDALSKRYRGTRDRAGLRPLRFHDLRHTFGSLAVDGGASLVQVQAWMGHADVGTTMRYLHSKRRTEDAALLGAAFRDPSRRAAARS